MPEPIELVAVADTRHRHRHRHRHRRRGRLALAAVAGTAAIAAGAALRRRRALIEPVNADLRSPVLHLPLSLTSERVLRLLRALPMPDVGVRPGVEVEPVVVPGPTGAGDVRALRYERPGRSRPSGAVLWIHGGGYVLGTPEQGNVVCSRWADELGLLAVSVDYRLAPEDPFPAGLEDCYAALVWLHEHAEELGVDPDRIAVGGDSAGGGLAAALAQLARDRGGPPVAFSLLVYPMLDDRTVLRTDHGGTGAFVWTPASNRFGWTAYLGRAPSASAPPRHAAPGRTEDLAGLPPTWIGVGDLDLFLAEDVDYARRLEQAGVPTELHVEPGMYHGADSVLVDAPTSVAFRERMTRALASGLGLAAAAGGATAG